MIHPDTVEEADIELCAAGFDNLLLDAGQKELRLFLEMLKEMRAVECAVVIQELLEWVDGVSGVHPLDVVEGDTERYNDLWKRYNAASQKEDPRKLSKQL